VAPALNSEFALGDGGGRTTPDECEASVLVLAGVAPVVPESLGEEPAVWLPASEGSLELGICTLSLGRTSRAMLLVREDGAIGGTEEADWVR
jgi:hypothetical protein